MTHKKKKIIKKTKNKSGKKSGKKYTIKNRLFLISAFLILLFLGFGYYYFQTQDGTKQNREITKSKTTQKIESEKSTKKLMSKMRKMLKEQNGTLEKIKKDIKKDINKIKTVTTKRVDINKTEAIKKLKLKKTTEIKAQKREMKKNYLSEINDYEKSLKYANTKHKKIKKVKKYSGKPKLAIIIDDVSFLSQVKQIKKIPFKVTPSFFPPTRVHPDTVKLSQKFKFAMIHLPLEAMGYAHPEPKTLLISSTKNEIESRVKEIKKEFPQIHYYNNHTGSKFTANLRAMKCLIGYMKTQNLHFVDSRTTIDTKAGIVSQALHVKLLSRDVFLDNIAKPKKIIEQLKKAVKLAKKSGYAIAIGHPHTNTLKTLIGAKMYLGDVELVYVDEL